FSDPAGVSATFVVCFIFFFQAEDGIRARNVTGVQTCALPISTTRPHGTGAKTKSNGQYWRIALVAAKNSSHGAASPWSLRINPRSEERRVGQEWGCRGGRETQEEKERRA